jgi:hypothetical protein
MERGVKLAAAAVLAAVAVVAALLAHDVRSRQHALQRGDLVYAASPRHASWTPSAALGGVSASLLGTGDDVAWRRALRLYADFLGTPNRLDTAAERQSARAQAERALAEAARGGHASDADTLLGVLAFDTTAGADASIAAFTNAIRADPTNTAAKYDLELLLRFSAAKGSRSGAGQGGSIGKGGRRGAGGGIPGNGY